MARILASRNDAVGGSLITYELLFTKSTAHKRLAGWLDKFI